MSVIINDKIWTKEENQYLWCSCQILQILFPVLFALRSALDHYTIGCLYDDNFWGLSMFQLISVTHLVGWIWVNWSKLKYLLGCSILELKFLWSLPSVRKLVGYNCTQDQDLWAVLLSLNVSIYWIRTEHCIFWWLFPLLLFSLLQWCKATSDKRKVPHWVIVWP